MGGGMPIGAFIASWELMNLLTFQPKLGHITTFGGHPISCAAALATFNELQQSNILSSISKKHALFKRYLKHPKIKKINGIGLMLALEFENEIICREIIKKTLLNNVITFYFLFDKKCMRLSPPLTIKEEEIKESCQMIVKSINEYYMKK